MSDWVCISYNTFAFEFGMDVSCSRDPRWDEVEAANMLWATKIVRLSDGDAGTSKTVRRDTGLWSWTPGVFDLRSVASSASWCWCIVSAGWFDASEESFYEAKIGCTANFAYAVIEVLLLFGRRQCSENTPTVNGYDDNMTTIEMDLYFHVEWCYATVGSGIIRWKSMCQSVSQEVSGWWKMV